MKFFLLGLLTFSVFAIQALPMWDESPWTLDPELTIGLPLIGMGIAVFIQVLALLDRRQQFKTQKLIAQLNASKAELEKTIDECEDRWQTDSRRDQEAKQDLLQQLETARDRGLSLEQALKQERRVSAEARKQVKPPSIQLYQVLALLQEQGRLLDFVMEDIDAATDEQIGAAARVVHSGCRQIFDKHFQLENIRSEEEGSELTLKESELTGVRLLGQVKQAPHTGTLLHCGWRNTKLELPEVLGESDVLMPAELEVNS